VTAEAFPAVHANSCASNRQAIEALELSALARPALAFRPAPQRHYRLMFASRTWPCGVVPGRSYLRSRLKPLSLVRMPGGACVGLLARAPRVADLAALHGVSCCRAGFLLRARSPVKPARNWSRHREKPRWPGARDQARPRPYAPSPSPRSLRPLSVVISKFDREAAPPGHEQFERGWRALDTAPYVRRIVVSLDRDDVPAAETRA